MAAEPVEVEVEKDKEVATGEEKAGNGHGKSGKAVWGPETQSSEASLGITEFLNPSNPGFPGAVIKQRFSDFNVTEIGLSGEPVRLDGCQMPDETPEDARGEDALLYSSLTEEQRGVFPELDFIKANIYNNQLEPDTKDKVRRKAPDTDTLEIDVTERGKEERRLVHTVLKRFNKLDSNTLEREGRKVIMVRRKKGGKSESGFRHWPRDRPRFLHFTLFKQNCETFEAISGLAQKTRVDPKHFSYAGTKDRRGRTLQRVSVSMTSAAKILGAAVGNWKVEVGNFSYEKADLKLGDLKGNRFELAVRNISAEAAVLDPVMEHFRTHGFINYFGTQRFGTSAAVPTSSIGKALLSSNYEEAIDLILAPREQERLHCVREAREEWAASRDPHRALAVLRRGGKDRVVEGRLLHGLTRAHKNDQVGALEEIPPHQRSMYCHAFQSLLWNRVVSRRVRLHGRAVLRGDLVYKRGGHVQEEGGASKEELVEEVVEPADWAFTDVLVPIPGCRVKWPANETREWFTEELAKEGVGWECFESSVKSYNMPGDYRHLCVVAGEVRWSLVPYTDTEADLLPSLKELNTRQAGEDKEASGNGSVEDAGQTAEAAKGGNEPEVKEAEGAKPEYSALLVSLRLPSSTYATMALREVLRVETDRASLARQNDYKRPAGDSGGAGEPRAKLARLSGAD
jgi:tRNA pseudouridine13 synthase